MLWWHTVDSTPATWNCFFSTFTSLSFYIQLCKKAWSVLFYKDWLAFPHAKNPTCYAILLLLSCKTFLFLQEPSPSPSKCPRVNTQVNTPMYRCPIEENRPHFPVLLWSSLSLPVPLQGTHCNSQAGFSLHSPQELPFGEGVIQKLLVLSGALVSVPCFQPPFYAFLRFLDSFLRHPFEDLNLTSIGWYYSLRFSFYSSKCSYCSPSMVLLPHLCLKCI